MPHETSRREAIVLLAQFGSLAAVNPSLSQPQTQTERATRLNYEKSCEHLQKIGYLDKGSIPSMPRKMPSASDRRLGVSFFRTRLSDVKLDNLTLPRTFFGRSEILKVSFKNTDLTQSSMCWNDFEKIDCNNTMLEKCDMRASTFTSVNFQRADLRLSDLRLSTFEGCDFADAIMTGVILTREQGSKLDLSARQRTVIAWTDDAGKEPAGG